MATYDDILQSLWRIETISNTNASRVEIAFNAYRQEAQSIVDNVARAVVFQVVQKLSTIQTMLSGYMANIQILLDNLDKRVASIDNTSKVILETLVKDIKPLLEAFITRINYVMKTLDTFVLEFGQRMEEQLQTFRTDINNLFTMLNDFISNQTRMILENNASNMKTIQNDMITNTKQIISDVKASENNIKDSIIANTLSVIQNTNSQSQSIRDKLDNEIGDISQSVDKLDNDLNATLWAIYRDFKAWVTEMFTLLPEEAVALYKTSRDVNKNIMDSINPEQLRLRI